MDSGAERGAGAGGTQGRHGGGGPDPAEQRGRTVVGSVTSGVRTPWPEMSEEGWGMVPSCSGHARSRSQTGRPDGGQQRRGWRHCSAPPGIDAENLLSERLDPAFP